MGTLSRTYVLRDVSFSQEEVFCKQNIGKCKECGRVEEPVRGKDTKPVHAAQKAVEGPGAIREAGPPSEGTGQRS